MEKIFNLISELEKKEISNQQIATVEIFLSKGLSATDLKEALIKSYSNKSIKAPWNYFCAVCWRIIRRTERGSLGESVSSYGKFPWS